MFPTCKLLYIAMYKYLDIYLYCNVDKHIILFVSFKTKIISKSCSKTL